MKNLLLVFLALLAMSGTFSFNLWRDLRTQQQDNEELRSQLAKSGGVPQASATPVTPATPAPSVATPPPAAVSEAPVAAARPTPTLVDSDVFGAAMTASMLARTTAGLSGYNERNLLKDPEYRKAQLTQSRLRLALGNPGLVETLRLSPAEADHLFEVMAETQLDLTGEFMEAAAKAPGTTPSLVAMREMASGREDPTRAVLGEARYAQYQDYVRNAKPALSRLSSLGATLSSGSQPLSDSQARALGAAILTERQRQEAVAASRPSPNPGASRNTADMLAEYRRNEEESRRRVIEAVTPHLDAAQIDLLQKEHEQQMAMARRTDALLPSSPQPATGNQP